MKILPAFLLVMILATGLLAQEKTKQGTTPPAKPTKAISEWEKLRFGAFVHFNDNTSVGTEISRNTDTGVFNPVNLNFDSIMSTFNKAGIKYAVLTTRHTSGFCLWDSKATAFNVIKSPYKKDVVRMFVDACRKYNIKPCFYYCLWGGGWKPWEWNPMIKKELSVSTPKKIIVSQLKELSENYGDIFEFWLDMYVWCDTTLKPHEIYNLLKSKNPNTIVHFNQQVQDGSEIKYSPTDIVNGEERLPPVSGHNPQRLIDSIPHYLPLEYEITSQQNSNRSLKNGLMEGSVWFTYPDSKFYPVDSLYHYIKQSFNRGGSNILLSTAPDPTGTYRQADRDSLIKLGKLIWGYRAK
jgi:alpha-L-fucosidase